MMICPHCQGRTFFVYFTRHSAMRLLITCNDTGDYEPEDYKEEGSDDFEWEKMGTCTECRREVRIALAMEVWQQAQAEPEPEREEEPS